MPTYTCPMHPEIQRPHPGVCPLCGMALEPMEPTKNEDNRELKTMLLRFWISAFLTIPIVLFAMFERFEAIQALLATPIVLGCGAFFFARGILSLNMFTLISLGVGVSYVYSLFAVFSQKADFPIYFEAAAVITTLVILGQVLELKARSKTSGAIRALLDLTPPMATIVKDEKEVEVSIDQVKKGDMLRIRPGSKIPSDGKVIEGQGVIDESMITGEAIPVMKKVGDKLFAGTLNTTSSFLMEVEKVGEETLLAQIIQLVKDAERSKAPIQRIADRVASYFVPIVLLIAIATFFIWLPHSFFFALVNGISVLIIACPCALGLATPLSIMVGIGKGATMGILIKNSESLELMAKVDTLVTDKTGTLTEGKITVTHIVSENVDEILQLGASLGNASEHPLSHALVEKAHEKKLPLLKINNFQSHTGRGIEGEIEGQKIALGNQKLIPTVDFHPEEYLNEGATVLYVAKNSKPLGFIVLKDNLKTHTKEAIALLHKENMRILMVTGDNKLTANVIGKALGIDEVHAEILPAEKNHIIRELKKEGHLVAMAGDGINDAPALAEADVGIAMGKGTDIAIGSASIVLMKGDLRSILSARKLSKKTVQNIRQNLFFAFFYNCVGVPIAAGVLYPFFGIVLSPMISSAAMTLSSLSVIWNALRLKTFKT